LLLAIERVLTNATFVLTAEGELAAVLVIEGERLVAVGGV
jgi:hypothetical protein